MPYSYVHTFTALSGITYFINIDFDTNTVLTTWSPAEATPDAFVTEAELGVEINSLGVAMCSGTTRKTAIIKEYFPFAMYVAEPESVACGFTGPVCDISFVATPTNATNGGANGSISITPTPAGEYQYSLNNYTWQTTPNFSFLFPGTYNVYVRNSEGCMISQVVVVGNTVVAQPVLPAEIPFDRSNRLCFFFRLIIGGVTHAIREPIKWDDVNIIGSRDPEFHGYQFKYSDGDVSLGFDCKAGMELIEAEYNTSGQDGDIKFQYGYTFAGEEYILFPGKLMLNTYKWYAEKVECTVEAEDIDTVFTSRLETKVSMTQEETFDGNLVAAPTPYPLPLHAKEILTRIVSTTEDKGYESGYTTHTAFQSIKPDNTNYTISEISQSFQYPIGNQFDSPPNIDEYLILFDSGGTAEVEINLDMDIFIKRNSGALAGNRDFICQVLYTKILFNPGTNAYDTIQQDITTGSNEKRFGTEANPELVYNIQGTISETVNITAGDKIFCYIQFVFQTNDYKYKFTLHQNEFTFNVTHLESSQSTPANVWFLEDVLRHCISVISDNGYGMRSSFFERANSIQLNDGCGSKYVLTNGFQIRQFEVAQRALKIDLKKALTSLNAQFCIGYNYIKDTTGSYVRIERADYFYQEKEILAIYELQSYREEVAIDIIYNEIANGYEKYQDSGFNSLDEFNTKREWLTAIKKNKKKLSILSSFITSGYSIEDIRRVQFRDTPTSSATNDEEPFMISVKRVDTANFETEKDEAFETVTGIISPETAYNLRISPMRMLYNWLIWLKGIFAYKVDADKITNTFITQNNELITRFHADETCRVGDEDRATLEEKGNIPMTAMATTRDIYRPERAIFKCRLSPQQIQVLNLAMTDRYGPEKDRGYIMVKKPRTGVWQAVWITKLSYNFWTEEAEITGLKKFVSPEEPSTEDCCNWLVVNGCYIKVNDEKLIA